MKMPTPDAGVISRRSKIIAALSDFVPGESVISNEDELRVYECDGLSAYRQLPMAVVLPETTAQVSAILKYCYDEGIKVVPRGAGTSLSLCT
jgi:glycolate oxidase